jgi:hypothetical protein
LVVSLNRLRKKAALSLILGGAAVHRCDIRLVLSEALAAEGTLFTSEMTFSASCEAMR